MKKSDPLQQYRALRSALSLERDAIQKRLQELNAALGDTKAPITASPVAKKLGRPAGKAKRVENTMSLREAVLKVLTATPITRQELLAAVLKVGYRFSGSQPLNSLQTFLYGSGKKLVKNVDGKFAAVGASIPATAPKTEAAKPVKKKGKMSAVGLANIKAAQKARWAKVKAGAPAAPKTEAAKVEPAKPAKKKSKMSAAGLANIRAAQKARWAKINATKAKK